MAGLSPTHLILILIIALIVLGPGKLPETAAALGRAIREFRSAADGTDAPASAVTPPAAPTPAAVATSATPEPPTDAPTRPDSDPPTPS